MKVIQTGPLRGVDDLPVDLHVSAEPLHSCLDEVTVRQRLHHGSRPVVVIPANIANEGLLVSVPPEPQFERFDAVDSKFYRRAAFAPGRPGVSQQSVGQETEVVRLARSQIHRTNPFGAIALPGEDHLVLAGFHAGVHRAARP